MTAREIQTVLSARFADHKYQLKNVYIYGPKWESDWFSITPRDIAMEIEIKVVRSDYHMDFKKEIRHQTLQNAPKNRRVCPNMFYFCTPAGLLMQEEIPFYAGLMEVSADQCTIVKKAPVLHTDKSCMKDILAEKFYYRTLNLERQIIKMQQEINYYQSDGYYQWVSQHPHTTISTVETQEVPDPLV